MQLLPLTKNVSLKLVRKFRLFDYELPLTPCTAPYNKRCTFLHHNLVSADWLYCMWASRPKFGSVTEREHAAHHLQNDLKLLFPVSPQSPTHLGSTSHPRLRPWLPSPWQAQQLSRQGLPFRRSHACPWLPAQQPKKVSRPPLLFLLVRKLSLRDGGRAS